MARSCFIFILLLAMALPAMVSAQCRLGRLSRFHKQMPPGNYSGITCIGTDRYAVVDDKASTDGFYVFRIGIDTTRAVVTAVVNEGYFSSGLDNRDMEGIAFFPVANTVFISGEKDNQVYEYGLDGKRTGRRLMMPDCYKKARRNLGLESLAYDQAAHCFYTTTERPLPGDSLLRIQCFGDDLLPARQYLYTPDPPISRKYIAGVSELCAIGDGRLLVLERQIRVPKLKIGAKAVVSIYSVSPGDDQVLQKSLVTRFTTRVNVTSRKFANFEGMCSPLHNWLLLVADSQNRYKGVLKDWMRLVRL